MGDFSMETAVTYKMYSMHLLGKHPPIVTILASASSLSLLLKQLKSNPHVELQRVRFARKLPQVDTVYDLGRWTKMWWSSFFTQPSISDYV